jgi:hypothetical protein
MTASCTTRFTSVEVLTPAWWGRYRCSSGRRGTVHHLPLARSQLCFPTSIPSLFVFLYPYDWLLPGRWTQQVPSKRCYISANIPGILSLKSAFLYLSSVQVFHIVLGSHRRPVVELACNRFYHIQGVSKMIGQTSRVSSLHQHKTTISHCMNKSPEMSGC